jgi:hypothetical protein
MQGPEKIRLSAGLAFTQNHQISLEHIIIQHLNQNNVLQMMAKSLEMCF